jgi:hypothetical protein
MEDVRELTADCTSSVLKVLVQEHNHLVAYLKALAAVHPEPSSLPDPPKRISVTGIVTL